MQVGPNPISDEEAQTLLIVNIIVGGHTTCNATWNCSSLATPAPKYWSSPLRRDATLNTKTTRWLPRWPTVWKPDNCKSTVSIAWTAKAGTTSGRILTGACNGICNTNATSST